MRPSHGHGIDFGNIGVVPGWFAAAHCGHVELLRRGRAYRHHSWIDAMEQGHFLDLNLIGPAVLRRNRSADRDDGFVVVASLGRGRSKDWEEGACRSAWREPVLLNSRSAMLPRPITGVADNSPFGGRAPAADRSHVRWPAACQFCRNLSHVGHLAFRDVSVAFRHAAPVAMEI